MTLIKTCILWIGLLSVATLAGCFESEQPKNHQHQDEKLGYKAKHGFEPGTKSDFNTKSKSGFTTGGDAGSTPKTKSDYKSHDK